jgi:hypothetical protein
MLTALENPEVSPVVRFVAVLESTV